MLGAPKRTFASTRVQEISGLSTEPGSRSFCWRRRPQDEIVWAFFDNDFVAFHRPSGKTHFLNAASYVLLDDVLSETRDFASILDVFASESTEENDDAYQRQMISLLDRLERLGLIEQA